MAAGSIVIRIGNLDIQFDKDFNQQKANQLVQTLQQVITSLKKLANEVNVIKAAENAGTGTSVLPHVLAGEAGLGPDHTASGLIPGQVLQAIASNNAAFANLKFQNLYGVDPATFDTPLEGYVIEYHDGYWSAVPNTGGFNPGMPGVTAVLMWNQATASYVWAAAGSGITYSGASIAVDPTSIQHALLADLVFSAAAPTVYADDHPQYGILTPNNTGARALNTWLTNQLFSGTAEFQFGLTSDGDIILTGNLEQSQAEPEYLAQNTDDTTDEGTWRQHYEPGMWVGSAVLDDGSDGENWITVSRNGGQIDQINLQGANLYFNGDEVVTGALTVNGSPGDAGRVLAGRLGNQLLFNDLVAGANVTITPGPTGLTIASTGGGGGGSPTTAFAIASLRA